VTLQSFFKFYFLGYSAAMAKYSSDNGIICSPKMMYFAIKNDFEEVQKFIQESIETYHLDVKAYDCGIFEVLAVVLVHNKIYLRTYFIRVYQLI